MSMGRESHLDSDDVRPSMSTTIVQQGFLKRHGQGLLSMSSNVWVILYADRIEWSSDKKAKVDNNSRMELDHTSIVNGTGNGAIQIQTGGATGRLVVFEAASSTSSTIWEAAFAGVISKLKADKKMRPSVVMFNKTATRRNSLLGYRPSLPRPSFATAVSGPEAVTRRASCTVGAGSGGGSGGIPTADPDKDEEVALYEGYLQKRGQIRQSWTNRYFVLTSQRLTYFTDSSMQEAKGFIALNAYSYIQPRKHPDNSPHRQLFSLHTSGQLKEAGVVAGKSTSDEIDRHMLLMNGLSEEDVSNWCSAVSKVIIQQKLRAHPRVSVCVSTFVRHPDVRSVVGTNPVNFYLLQLLNANGRVLCEGYAYFADLKSLLFSVTSATTLALSETFPRSYKRHSFGVALTDDILENRRLKLELWLQDLASSLTLAVDEAVKDAAIDSVMAELGVHFSCSAQEMRKILTKEEVVVSKTSLSGLSKLFGSARPKTAAGVEPTATATATATASTESKMIASSASSGTSDKQSASASSPLPLSALPSGEEKSGPPELPVNPAALATMDLLQLLTFCRHNNIDASSFRTRNEYLVALGAVYRSKKPFLLGKDARSVVSELTKNFNADRHVTSKSHKYSENKSIIRTVFNDSLVKLEACPDMSQYWQDSYNTEDKLTVINNVIHIWDQNLSFTPEDCASMAALHDPCCAWEPAALLLLKSRLVEAMREPEWMHLFCAKKGIAGIVTQLQRHLECVPMSNLAAVSIIELVKCARLLVESSGRSAVIQSKNVIFTITLALQSFEHTALAAECLEFLTESIVYGGALAQSQIINSLEFLATTRNEWPFEILLHMLAVDNLALHCSVLSLINLMVLCEKTTKKRIKLHSTVNLLGFERICGALCAMDLTNSASCSQLVESLLAAHTGGVAGTSSHEGASGKPGDGGEGGEGSDGGDVNDEEGMDTCQLRPGVSYNPALRAARATPDDTLLHPALGIMASYTQEILPLSFSADDPPTGGFVVAKQFRRMTINIIEDLATIPGKTIPGIAPSSAAASKNETQKFTELTRWLHLVDDVLTITEKISKSKRGGSGNNSSKRSKQSGDASNGQTELTTRLFVSEMSRVLDYGDYGTDSIPNSVVGCITVIMNDQKKRFFHFGEDYDTKNSWLIALNASMENGLFQKTLYSTKPQVELCSAAKHKFKKKFDKLFSLYRSIREEDAIKVFNEDILPHSESLAASTSSSLPLLSSAMTPVEMTQYVQYEFQRRKDVKLYLLLKELAQYFVKNYPPKLPDGDKGEEARVLHPPAVVDSDRVVPRAPPLPALPPEKSVPVAHVKMKQIFWNKIKPVNVMSTFWMHLAEPEGIKWTALEEKFGEAPVVRRKAIEKQRPGGPAGRDITEGAGRDKQKLVNLFDSRRTQNVAIACAKLKKTPVEINEIVLSMDPLSLTLDVTEVILHLLLPTADEIATLRAYTGSIDQLDYCGQLFSYFSQIDELESRLVVQKIMLSWGDEATYALTLLGDAKKALAELKSEATLVPLQGLMATVLAVGNYMNGSNRTGKAHGFKLDTLLKLKDIREKIIPQRSLLHFVIEQFPSPDQSVFYAHWEVLWRMPKVSRANVENVLKQLRESLEVCIAAIQAGGEIQNEVNRENLVQRLSTFINKSSVIYDEACELFETLDDSVILVKRYFGEILMSSNLELDDDPWTGFFTTLVQFAAMHKAASKELVDLDRRRKQQAERDAATEDRKKKQAAAAAAAFRSKKKQNGVDDATHPHHDAELGPDDDQESDVSPSSPPLPASSSGDSDDGDIDTARHVARRPPTTPRTPPSSSKSANLNIREIFNERMLALHAGQDSDSEEEW